MVLPSTVRRIDRLAWIRARLRAVPKNVLIAAVVLTLLLLLMVLLSSSVSFHGPSIHYDDEDVSPLLHLKGELQKKYEHGQQLGDNDNDEFEKELAESLAYVKSIKSFDRTLKFFHIPKTAGTAIEAAAGRHRIPWGSCLFNHRPKRGICNYPEGGEWPRNVGWWHVPSQFFPVKGVNPYYGAELFAVIRNPYERMVSEFYYICTLRVTDWRPDQCNRTRLMDKEYMNEWLRSKMREQDQEPTGKKYITDNGHFIPQYDFIFGPHQVRMIDYVLKLDDDSLSEDFSRLMQAFSLERLKLKKINAIGAVERSEDHLGVADLDENTRTAIQQLYAKDDLMLPQNLQNHYAG